MLYPLAGKEPQTRAPKPALTEAELQAFIEQGIGALANGLEPLCRAGCRALTARADPTLGWRMGLHGNRSRGDFVILYRPDAFRAMLTDGESVALCGLAHELGHFVDVTIAGSDLDDAWRGELSADVVAGCAFATLRLRHDLVRATMMARIAPENSIDSRLDLACGSDSEHPAIRWHLAAFDTGSRLCRDGVTPFEHLEREASDLTRDAKREAVKARASLPAGADPCR